MKLGHVRDHMYARLVRSDRVLTASLAVRAVMTALVGTRLASSTLPELNGEFWIAELVSEHVRVALDVGANGGDWAELALRRFPNLTQLVAYEPGLVVESLRDRIGSDHRATIVDAAVSDVSGTISFADDRTDSKLSSVLTIGSSETRSVRAVCIDDELRERNIEHVDFLKIDAEGFDAHVLRGARHSLEDQRIDIVQFEYGPMWQYAGSTLAAVSRMLGEFGYEVFLLTSGSLREFPPEDVPELFTYANFVALRSPIADRLRRWIKPGW